MKINKRYLAITAGLLSLIALFIWYFLPVLMGEFLIQKSVSQQNHLNVRPVYIKQLPLPPRSWANISIDSLSVRLPVSTYTKISGKNDYISFRSAQRSISFISLAPFEPLIKTLREQNLKYPLLSFDERLPIYKVLPADLSFLNSRDENERISFFLSQKAAVPFEEVLIVDADKLKAICIIFKKGQSGFNALLDIYSPNKAVLITAMIYCYKDRASLKSDLLNILGGLKMPNQPLQADKVKEDITTIVNRYNRTEQIAQPDHE